MAAGAKNHTIRLGRRFGCEKGGHGRLPFGFVGRGHGCGTICRSGSSIIRESTVSAVGTQSFQHQFDGRPMRESTNVCLFMARNFHFGIMDTPPMDQGEGSGIFGVSQ